MLKYIILGIAQGLTEFLPVSSSGHLVILQRVFGISANQVAVSVILHLGTLSALCIFFFKDILRLFNHPRALGLIVIVTFITGIIGVAGKGFFEELFSSPKFVALAWLITGAVLLLTRNFMQPKKHHVDPRDATILGLAQGIAIIPGLSRSGMTVSTLLFRGIDRETSFHFSFLASIPAIVGAAIVEARDINFIFQGETKNFLAGFACSLITGFFALRLMHTLVRQAKLYYFGYYCIFAALVTLVFIK
jgi:undecaprenyl-diphosphatase